MGWKVSQIITFGVFNFYPLSIEPLRGSREVETVTVSVTILTLHLRERVHSMKTSPTPGTERLSVPGILVDLVGDSWNSRWRVRSVVGCHRRSSGVEAPFVIPPSCTWTYREFGFTLSNDDVGNHLNRWRHSNQRSRPFTFILKRGHQ